MIKKLKIIILATAVICFGINSAITASASQTDLRNYQFNGSELLRVDSETKIEEYGRSKSVSSVIMEIIKYATRVVGTIAVIILIIGGLTMVIAQGDENTISKGKDIVKYAVIGLIVTFLSYVIVTFVQSFVTTEVIDIGTDRTPSEFNSTTPEGKDSPTKEEPIDPPPLPDSTSTPKP
ncbi:hypothetical protein CVV38_04200 [Candidatus Peregrinibacteria bacterium HGW-Peregrinibacteria-1]|jgi:type IV secretory pathway VirB2 component (pilin)|nr:MAG: hypothetical protein CVV38_04200 [Candidatus Peregrinibacteria bacterium HGW-Peregrinibacteria-1]